MCHYINEPTTVRLCFAKKSAGLRPSKKQKVSGTGSPGKCGKQYLCCVYPENPARLRGSYQGYIETSQSLLGQPKSVEEIEDYIDADTVEDDI